MSDDTTVPAAEEPETAPETTETPETEASAPETTGEMPEGEQPEAEGESAEIFEGLDKGLEKTAKAEIAKTVENKLTENALKIQRQVEAGGRLGRLAEVWNELSDEGKAAYLNSHTAFKEWLKTSFDPSRHARRLIKSAILPNKWLEVEDFPVMEVRSYVALGVLDCPETLAKAGDEEVVKFITGLKVATGLAKFWLPEVGVIEKPLAIAAILGKEMKEILPRVRARVRKEAVVVPITQKEEHDKEVTAAGMEKGGPSAPTQEGGMRIAA